MNPVDIASTNTSAPIVRDSAVSAARHRRHGEDARTPEVHVRPADSVDISALARRLGLITGGEAGEAVDRAATTDRPFRADLVARVKREIAAGTYETPEKLDITAERVGRELDIQG